MVKKPVAKATGKELLREFLILVFFLIQVVAFTFLYMFSDKIWRMALLKNIWYDATPSPYPLMKTFCQTGYVISEQDKQWFKTFMAKNEFIEANDVLSHNCSLMIHHQNTDNDSLTHFIVGHQKINRIPAFNSITRKPKLVIYPDLPAIPPAFALPQDAEKFSNYLAQHPKARFLKKSYHKSIELIEQDEAEFMVGNNFIQMFVEDALLMEGYRFELDLFILVTSISPLKAYLKKDRVNFKFCSEKFLPFDPFNQNKYIANNTWKPPFYTEKRKEKKMSNVNILDEVLREYNGSLDTLWKDIEDVLGRILTKINKDIRKEQIMRSYPNERGFFELVRADFLIDEKFKPHLLEFERPTWPSFPSVPVLSTVLKMIGYGPQYVYKNVDTSLSNFDPGNCTDCASAIECATFQCTLCPNCLTSKDQNAIMEAVIEKSIGESKQFHRIVPIPLLNKFNAFQEILELNIKQDFEPLGRADWVLHQWFARKCLTDNTWCT